MLDVIALQILKRRADYYRYAGIAIDAANDIGRVILRGYGAYFKQYPDRKEIDTTQFYSYMVSFQLKGANQETKDSFESVVTKLKGYPDKETTSAFSVRLSEKKLAFDLRKKLDAYDCGEEVDLAAVSKVALDSHKHTLVKHQDVDHVVIDIKAMIKDEQNEVGLKWRSPYLNSCMRPLNAGDFGAFAGRVDVGKTSKVIDEVTFLAKQLNMHHAELGIGKNVLYFNNESGGNKIKFRCYQSALQMSTPELSKLDAGGALDEVYRVALGGADNIFVIECQRWTHTQMELLIDKYKPGLVIYDMLDKVAYTGVDSGARTDQKLENLYDWARENCVIYKHIGIANTQLSADAANMEYPELHMLKDSKTGKQGTLDFMITIGKNNNPMDEALRFLGTPKNKLRRPNSSPRSGYIEYDGQRCIFNEKKE